ncbi:MAG TPA: GNAT family N-acetyltransferase [Pirellulales bacterium]|jgi:GNAT superfamily N-acetyltransferase
MDDKMMDIVEADLCLADHQEATRRLLNRYAMDPMGDGKPLSESAARDLIPGLKALPTTMVFLAYSEREAVGLAICFRGFSTFAARPLVNIHDFFVMPGFRGLGFGRGLLAAVERRAREIGCCKLTLEVQENNHRAQDLYAAAGFGKTVHVAAAGGALFLSKPLEFRSRFLV